MTTLKEVLALAASLWPNPAWPPEVQAIWAASLAEIDPEQLKAAVLHFYSEHEKSFRPTPGELRHVMRAPDPAAAEIGWLAFKRAVDHYACKPGAPGMPSFADPEVAATITRIGGFAQFLGGIQVKELDFLRSKFLRAYGRPDDSRPPQLRPFQAPPELTEGMGDMP